MSPTHTPRFPVQSSLRGVVVSGISLLLAGCISFGGEAPEMLLTLTSSAASPAGPGASGPKENALLVEEPDAPQQIAVTRIPVQVDDSSVAYLKDAVWVERPARLFRRLLAETVRSKSGRLVMERDDPTIVPAEVLSGTLREFGYDAIGGNVTVTFDGIRTLADGTLETRRFTSRVADVEAKGVPVGAALNTAANDVAEQVADWLI